jgi:hypothetical protein
LHLSLHLLLAIEVAAIWLLLAVNQVIKHLSET